MYIAVHNLDTWYTQKVSKLQVSKDLQKFHATFSLKYNNTVPSLLTIAIIVLFAFCALNQMQINSKQLNITG